MKTKTKQHPVKIDKYDGSLEQLAIELGDLQYDVLGELLTRLSLKLQQDAAKDIDRGREKLGNNLFDAGKSILDSAMSIGLAWEICEPHIK